jgi:hypothetical protein
MNVFGNVLLPSRPNWMGVSGPIPGLVVYVKHHNARVQAEFHRFCRLNALDALLIDEDRNAYEVVGGLGSLRKLMRHTSIESFHYRFDVKPPVMASGGGELTSGARRRLNAHRAARSVEAGFKYRERCRAAQATV